MDTEAIWKIIHSYFDENPQCLVRHHIESYNDFFKTGIFQIFKEKNPVTINTRYDEKIDDFRSQCIMYFGGKDGSKIYFGKPIIYDDHNSHFMFPNEARLRNMTYGMTIHYDIDIEYIDLLEEGEAPNIEGLEGGGEEYDDETSETVVIDSQDQVGGAPKEKRLKAPLKAPIRGKKRVDVAQTTIQAAILRAAIDESLTTKNRQVRTETLKNIFLGKFPIMVQSDFCVLSGLTREVRHTMGECRNDVGGYFIIDGKEKTVVCQEMFGNNMLYISQPSDDKVLYSADIRSVSENASKPVRTLSVKMMSLSPSFKNIVVNIPNVRKPIPLFIVFRALGIISDKQIITMCLLDMEKYETMVDLFTSSIYDAGGIMTQRNALKYIATCMKFKTIPNAIEVLTDYFLPHVGEMNYTQKAYYLGYIVFRMLSVYSGMEAPTDRDNFKYKRIETVGNLMYDLFREYYTIQQREIHLALESKIYYNKALYENNLMGLVNQNYKEIFKQRDVEIGFKKAFKGNWGSKPNTKRVGIVQDLNRLSFNSALSHLRKTNLPLDASVKVVGPRVLHSTQWGMFDPVDTPDGGNIGLHKHLSLSAYISKGVSREPMIQWLREKIDMKLIEDCSPAVLSTMTKVFVNGLWAGAIEFPLESVRKIRLFRRNALIPIYTSVTFETKSNTVFIYTDAGRICRPVFYRDDDHEGMDSKGTGKMSFEYGTSMDNIMTDKFTWLNLISGFNRRKDVHFDPNQYKMYELSELYEGIEVESNPAKLKRFLEEKAIIDYIDTNESEDALIALNIDKLTPRHTHLEIHESLIFGMLCNMINFPENNPATRNSFSCGQSKQAASMYHTNHQVRMDKTAVVLMSGQTPLVKSRYLEHITHEENSYGENVIVAIMCYTGYNVEDAMLINEGALKRGLFRTTYYSTYETHEEKSKSADSTTENIFTNIENDAMVTGTRPGYDYSQLDKYGLIRENCPVTEKTVLIGMTSMNSQNRTVKRDMSKTPKKGQLGIVDKSFITEGEEGQRIAKIRLREVRVPSIGDKMASRAGQKGTIGMVIPEADMPFTKDGIRPDIIINPHAIPSRMTIGQLVETITGKACAMYGAFGDCTAFINKGSKVGVFGNMLSKVGYHSSGNEILYNGMTGEQLDAEIFMGPNYYMRLKHMVKDKINYRALGPRTQLTRQPVSGRANDGGLRIGEMERDSLISHGTSEFLRESMMERGDKYFMAVCNVTGMVAIYNPSKNLFISPMADGPLKFTGDLDMNVEHVTRFGRSFSLVCIPFSLKLLIQELQTMNIQMRIITEDNIAQMENMTYSDNIQKLMFDDTITPQKIVEGIKTAIAKRERAKPIQLEPTPSESPEILAEILPEILPKFLPVSPTESPPYEPTSPAYEPTSPAYVPTSPAYVPTSADYVPTSETESPQYIPRSDNTSPAMPSAVQAVEQFAITEPVYYRGDKVPTRIWYVKSISPQFITIETDLTLDGEGPSDTIKVVNPIDIYKVGNVMPVTPALAQAQAQAQTINQLGGASNQGLSNHGFSGHGFPGQGFPTNPAINFNPVFKVITGGSDFSGDPTPSTQPTEEPMLNQPIVGGAGEKITNVGQLGSENDNNKIDFSKLVVKKM